MSIDVKTIFNNQNILSFDQISENFFSYTKTNFQAFNINKRYENEIEFTIHNVSLELFSILYNIPNNEKKCYIELKSKIDNDRFVRIREKTETEYIFDTNKLIENIKNNNMDEKTILNITKYDNYNFKTSREKKSNLSFMGLNKYKIYIINSISISNKYFKAEIKLKCLINNGNRKKIVYSYMDPKNTNRFTSFEIELNNKLTVLDEQLFKKYFYEIFIFSFAIQDKIPHMCFDEKHINLKTFMINAAELLKLDSSTTCITKKIDGLYMQFILYQSTIFIVSNNIIRRFKTNIKKSYHGKGVGEFIYISKKRKLYPFFFEYLYKNDEKINFKSRYEMFDIIPNMYTKKKFVNKSYEQFLDENSLELTIEIDQKEYIGPFNSQTEFYYGIIEMMNKITDYNSDGIILFNNTNLDSSTIRDYKFKTENSIDLYTLLDFNNNSKSNTQLPVLNFNLYFIGIKKIGDKMEKNFHLIQNSSMILTDNFSYDNEIVMIKYKDNNLLFKLFPLVFISEFFLNDKNIKPRMDKTEKLFSKQKYYGNPLEIIVKSIIIYKYDLNLTPDMLIELIDNNKIEEYIKEYEIKFEKYYKQEFELLKTYDEKNIQSDIEKESVKEEQLVKIPLNYKLNWYKNDDNIRSFSALNQFTNFNKTIGLLIGINSMTNQSKYKTLLSLYCGRGGDLGKFINNDISYVLGIDPDQEALNVFKNRYDTRIKQKNIKLFEFHEMVGRLEEKNLLQKIYNQIGYNFKFDIIDCQLGIHFSLCEETKNHIMKIFSSLSKNTNIKTKVLISTNDKNNIEELFKENNMTQDPINLKIDNNTFYTIKYYNDKIVEVLYQPSMNTYMKEYLISRSWLVETFKSYGFELLQDWTFDQVIINEDIMNYIVNIYERESTKKFLEKIKNINIEKYDLLKILKTFHYYIFEYNN